MRLKTTASAIAISTALIAQTAAAQSERVRFVIEAKHVSQALQEFAEQSGYQMAFLADAAADVRSHSVSGAFEPEVALRRLLEGTGLEYRLIDERTVAILRKTAEADSEGRSGETSLQYASANEEVQQSAALQEIAQAQTQTAQAQTQAAADESAEIEEIVVTGSRLTGSNLTSPVPVFQFGAEDVDARGATRIEDVLNVMPQVTAGQSTETDSLSFTGTSTVDLRNLGAIRTLPLINGKRLPFGSPEISAANIDIVPSQLVERVDIVTGGSSAVYGADAVAGVVNFILKDDFEGIEIDSQVDFRQNGNDMGVAERIGDASGITNPDSVTDGRGVSTTLLLGANAPNDRGNVTVYFGYENLNDIPSEDRDFSNCTLGDDDGPTSVNGVACDGSSNFRRIFTNDLPGTPENERLDLFQQADGTLVPFSNDPRQTFNFERGFTLQAKKERFNINAMGHYDVTDTVELYGDFAFMNSDTISRRSPDATFTGPFQVNCDNPLLDDAPSGELGTLFDLLQCGTILEAVENGEPNPVTGEIDSVDVPFINSFRLAQGPGLEGMPLDGPNGPLRRETQLKLTTWRAVVGFRGTIADHFEWDLFGQFSRTLEDRFERNQLDFDRVQQALFVVEDDNGNIVCRDPVAPGCAPFNIFDRTADGETLLTDEALAFTTSTVGIITGETEQQVVGGTIQGDLGRFGWQSPAAQTGINLLVGVEYREDTLELTPDKATQRSTGPGSGIGGGFTPVSGRVEVVEGYMETQIPLIENKPFFERWSLNGAYRRSQYNVDGKVLQELLKNDFNTDTWFVGTTWQPVQDVRLRAQFQRAVRAPNVIELFTPQNPGGFEMSGDPCAGPNPDASFEQCARSGVTQAQFGSIPQQPSREFNSVVGGNPELSPEVADTITAGIQWTPEAIPGLTISADYFNIEIEESIGQVPPQESVQQCIQTGNPEFCDLIRRDNFGSLFIETADEAGREFGVVATNVNIATIETSGVDFQIQYELPLSDLGFDNLGSLNFNYVSTWTTELETVPFTGADVIDCQDKFGDQCGTPRPAYKQHFATTWNTPVGLQVTATWRRIGDTDAFDDQDAPINESLETQDYIDLVLQHQMTDSLRFRLGVNNLFNTNPPITSVEGSGVATGNTFPGEFDVDRFIFFGVNYQL